MQTTLKVPVITPHTALEVRVVRLRLGLGLGLVLGCLVGAAVVGTVDTPPLYATVFTTIRCK